MTEAIQIIIFVYIIHNIEENTINNNNKKKNPNILKTIFKVFTKQGIF